MNGRLLRNLLHKKQGRTHVGKGVPHLRELEEATPVLRSVPGVGVVEYIRYKDQLYSSVYYLHDKHVKLALDRITLLNNGTVNDEDFPGTVTDNINDTTSSVQDDLASLAAKVNAILRLLVSSNIVESNEVVPGD